MSDAVDGAKHHHVWRLS